MSTMRVVLGVLIVSVLGLLAATQLMYVDEEGNVISSEAYRQIERDETPPAPNELDAYTVAPDAPRLIHIPKLSVRARVLPVGLTSAGAIGDPDGIHDAGWYTGSAKPGMEGAMVVDAHASGRTREGLFAYLDQLRTSDTVTIERGDHTELHYRVVRTETVPLARVNMQEVLQPHGNATEALNLITCAGDWVRNQQTRNYRVIVYTERMN